MRHLDDLKIYCKNTAEYISIDGGETLLEVYNTIKSRLNLQGEAVMARVNNKAEDLRFPVFGPKHVEFVDITANVRLSRDDALAVHGAL